MDEKLREVVGRRIREERDRAGMTLEQLAQEVGVSTRGQMSRFESGERGVDSTLLRRIAVALGVPMDAFFDEERGQMLTLARAGDSSDSAIRQMENAGLDLMADVEFADNLVRQHGW